MAIDEDTQESTGERVVDAVDRLKERLAELADGVLEALGELLLPQPKPVPVRIRYWPR
ncbi:MAG: hypothetical protein OEZ06_17830 [Myxococcales bacterium]|nr:hypothetical protein [Myxococcales bacterium]